MSLFIRTDVTAVKFFKNFILAGIGSTVNIFDKETTKILQRLHVLKGQKIHGFVPFISESKLLIFGGKQFIIASVNSTTVGDENILTLDFKEPIVCEDWLHSSIWINDHIVALLTAHNVVQKWDTLGRNLICEFKSRDNSILYSGLLVPLQNDVLVFAGTVFSEVIIHSCAHLKPLHHLKGHKGVIFSISCDPEKGIIVTTSDDRSVRIWGPNSTTNYEHSTTDYWASIQIVCKNELYAHKARVMRSCITHNSIVSVGEDSAVCFWDYQGKLLRRLMSQNGCIWSLDADSEDVVIGVEDSAVILHPLALALPLIQQNIVNVLYTPKEIAFTARRNIIILTDSNNLIYYDVSTDSIKRNVNLSNLELTHKLFCVSSCKQIVAVADMFGNLSVFIENCKNEADITTIISSKLKIGKILSMHWAGNRHLVFCSKNGIITVLAAIGTDFEVYDLYLLPASKERWLTACAINLENKMLVIGDRCGNIHVYFKGITNPIKTFNKIHGLYGPTSIIIRENEIKTTGRDGTIKYFYIMNKSVRYATSIHLGMKWVGKFLDRNENIICGFRERVFVVCDIKNKHKLLEIECGGGNRSWDAVRYMEKVNDDYETFIKLVHLRKARIHVVTFKLTKLVSRNVVNGSQSKEINCVKTLKTKLNEDKIFFISGGEDTTLSVSSLDVRSFTFQDEIIFKQLSSVKTLKTLDIGDNSLLLISAGGRAQICINMLRFQYENGETKVSLQELVDYLIKGTDKERKGNRTWREFTIDFDAETRIMDLEVINVENKYFIFAGCSDARLRVYEFMETSDNVIFNLIKELKHHTTCILKTHHINFLKKDIIVTCTTRGEVTFWDISDESKIENLAKPIFVINTSKSGINSISSKVISEKQLLVATGGDDNCVNLNLLEIADQNDLSSFKVLCTWSADRFHSSQITGICLLDNLMLSTSVDQRVTLFGWEIRNEVVTCYFVSQVSSDVADIQGLDVMDFADDGDKVTVCVFGKGFEVVQLQIPKPT